MFDKLSIPVKGEPPKAAWGAGVANRLNELCAMAPARTLVRDGATGTGFAPLPANLRDRRNAANMTDKSCFKIDSIDVEKDEDGEPTGIITMTFGNPYVMIGGIMHELAEPEIELDLEYYISFVFEDGQLYLRGYESLEEAIEDQKDKSKYVVLLYEINETGVVLTDFRNAPNVQVWEDLSDDEQN